MKIMSLLHNIMVHTFWKICRLTLMIFVAVKRRILAGRFPPDKSVRAKKGVFCAAGEEKSVGKFPAKIHDRALGGIIY